MHNIIELFKRLSSGNIKKENSIFYTYFLSFEMGVLRPSRNSPWWASVSEYTNVCERLNERIQRNVPEFEFVSSRKNNRLISSHFISFEPLSSLYVRLSVRPSI